jgi:hypothetical protein
MKKIILIIAMLQFINILLFACDMFMLQAIDQAPFLTYPSLNGNFNDPYDYFEDFKSLADGSSGNRDGYGIVAYTIDSEIVSRDYIWYKTGMGNHFDANNPDEALYQAMNILYDNPNIERVFVHARSGTGGQGSHPFIFNHNNKTYTFMHNGYIFNNAKRELMNFLGEEWFQEYPSQWYGEYGDTYSFIDSELIFHYLMKYIIQYPEDISKALSMAFTNKRVGNIDMEYMFKYNNSAILNFVLSDGIDSYVYRSSRLLGTSYNLSYQVYPNNFLAIKTNTNLENTIAKNQMLKFSSSGLIDTLSLSPILQTNFISKYVEKLDNNEFRLNWEILSNPNINSFNIYRSSNRDFSNSEKISSLIPTSPNQSTFSITDTYSASQDHYYWIEVVFLDSFRELTSNIPSDQEAEPPIVAETSEIISLYPNPFKEKLNISIDSQNDYKIKIYNLKGQLIDKLLYEGEKNNPLIWNTENINNHKLPNGIYILKLSNGGKNLSRKVMKIN